MEKFKWEKGDWHLYVLGLEGGYSYVGVSSNLYMRFHEHKMGKGAIFTKAHHPICVEKVLHLGEMSYAEACVFEDCYVLRELKDGHFKFRGGRYCLEKIKRDKEFYAMKYEELPEDVREVFEILLPEDVGFKFFKQPKEKRTSKRKKKGFRKKKKKGFQYGNPTEKDKAESEKMQKAYLERKNRFNEPIWGVKTGKGTSLKDLIIKVK